MVLRLIGIRDFGKSTYKWIRRVHLLFFCLVTHLMMPDIGHVFARRGGLWIAIGKFQLHRFIEKTTIALRISLSVMSTLLVLAFILFLF
ncbi:hypothetical protein LINGRAHAP2_LOCUS33179 [Linum grandiflorum]